MPVPHVRALLFDVFGTLFDWRTSLVTALRAFGNERAIACEWESFVDAWRAAYAPSMARVRRGETTWHNLDELHAASFDELAMRFALPPLSEQDHAWIVRRWHELRPWPDVVAGLERLHARYILGTLSNGNVSLLIDLMRSSGIRFDALFSAELFAHYKPDRETYLGAVALLGLAPQDVMLVAAHGADLHAAAALGLRTAFLSRPSEYGPARQADRVPDDGIDLSVSDTGELADVLLA